MRPYQTSSVRQVVPPKEISAQILRKLALDAGVFLNAEVNKAVITKNK